MLESSDKKRTIFKHRKGKKQTKKTPYMSSMQGSLITHLFRKNNNNKKNNE